MQDDDFWAEAASIYGEALAAIESFAAANSDDPQLALAWIEGRARRAIAAVLTEDEALT